MAAAAEQESAAPRLKITEIFFSIQGEAAFSGWPTVFVRLTGCPLRCQYCDTAYAFTGGEWRTFAEIETEIRRYGTQYVCVTGGEPLAQPRCAALLDVALRCGVRRLARDERRHRYLAGRHARRARRRLEDAGLEGRAPQSLAELGAPDAARRRQDRDLRPRRLRVGARRGHEALVAVRRVLLAEPRRAAGRHARRMDSRGPFARALAGTAAQSAVGQRAGA